MGEGGIAPSVLVVSINTLYTPMEMSNITHITYGSNIIEFTN